MDPRTVRRVVHLLRKVIALIDAPASETRTFVPVQDRATPAVDKDGNLAPDLADKLARKVCFSCGSIGDPNYKRGNCGADYSAIFGAIKRGEASEKRLIAVGQISPKNKGGRKRKRTFTPPGTDDPFAAGKLPPDLAQEAKEHAAKKKPTKRRG